MKFRVTCTGTRPLVMHNVQLASPLNPYARRLKALSTRAGKTDDDRMAIARVEFEGGMYWADLPVGPFVPAWNLLRSLQDGARLVRAGLKVQRGVVITDYMLPVVYDGPRDMDGLWGGGDSPFVDIRPVTVARSKVDRCRPIFRDWLIEAEMVVDPQVLDPGQFREITALAGEVAGLGDFRQIYGRYQASVREL